MPGARPSRAGAHPAEIRGYDADPRIVRTAEENIARIGLEKVVRVGVRPLAGTDPAQPCHCRWACWSAIRLTANAWVKAQLRGLYHQLGAVMVREFRAGRRRCSPRISILARPSACAATSAMRCGMARWPLTAAV